jgi:hypothetical protein
MSGKRKLSIGITVNLENYENLKVEVEGETDGEREAEELIEYLDSVLSRLGRNDPETKKRIDSYRRRVLESPGEHIKTGIYEPPKAPPVQETTPAGPEPAAGEPEEDKIPEKPVPEENPAGETGFSCSSCGRPISKAEEQLSQIFMGRSLCKKCLEEMQK